MNGVLKKLLISAVVFAAFYLAGCIAIYCEGLHDNLVASTAVFGVSFVSIIGGVVKLWYDMFV